MAHRGANTGCDIPCHRAGGAEAEQWTRDREEGNLDQYGAWRLRVLTVLEQEESGHICTRLSNSSPQAASLEPAVQFNGSLSLHTGVRAMKGRHQVPAFMELSVQQRRQELDP